MSRVLGREWGCRAGDMFLRLEFGPVRAESLLGCDRSVPAREENKQAQEGLQHMLRGHVGELLGSRGGSAGGGGWDTP